MIVPEAPLALLPFAAGDIPGFAVTHHTRTHWSVRVWGNALDGSPDMGPALYLEVRGPDRLGFLGGLLRPLARLGLSPWEMLITTRDGEAFDRFFLKMVSGAVPSEDVRRVLEAQLEAAVVGRQKKTA